MADVDAILASQTYTDRKGRTWHRCPSPPDEMDDGWWAYGRRIPGRFEYVSGATMRLKIERELHRDECPGLRACEGHPVPHVARHDRRLWHAYPPHGVASNLYRTHAAALDAARHMAGEQK